jgi:hypothetical protein
MSARGLVHHIDLTVSKLKLEYVHHATASER